MKDRKMIKCKIVDLIEKKRGGSRRRVWDSSEIPTGKRLLKFIQETFIRPSRIVRYLESRLSDN